MNALQDRRARQMTNFLRHNNEEKIMTSKRGLTGVSILLVLAMLAACGGGGGGGGAAPAPQVGVIALPETGQTTCADTAGTATPCADTGQDGDLKAGVAWPSPRFVVGTGATAACVTDNLTGLMWVGAPSVSVDTWANALTSANDLTLCGFSDWRLPNRKELRSLINYNLADSAAALNTQGFSNVQASYYWSSTSAAGSADSAWIVGMRLGNVLPDVKSGSSYLWPVRAGQ
jgi:Protein of unknown function (DUF1566)